jgi:hypothetical protein
MVTSPDVCPMDQGCVCMCGCFSFDGVCQEGIGLVLPYMTKRIAKATPADLFRLLVAGVNHVLLSCVERKSFLVPRSHVRTHSQQTHADLANDAAPCGCSLIHTALPAPCGCAGCWVLGAGCWVLGAGCWVLGAGCWVLGAGCWVLGAGCWVLGAGCWVLGAGLLLPCPAPFPAPILYSPCLLQGPVTLSVRCPDLA